MGTVETVRGPVAPADLGCVLSHEHVVNVTDWVQRDFPHLSWGGDRQDVIERIGARLRKIKASGVDTIIDVSVMGHSRDLPSVVEANALADIHIVAATGLYTYDALPFFFQRRPPVVAADGKIEDIITDMCLSDIRVGIQGTGVKAGVIKCATDKEGLTPNIERILRACARAHREAGVPIITHSDAATRNGLVQQRTFREEGVDLNRVVIGHAGDSRDVEYLSQLMEAGSYIGSDRFGLYNDGRPDMETRIAVIKALVERGFGSRILLSHDHSVFTDWSPDTGKTRPGLPLWRHDHITTEVLPAMRQAGISEEAIQLMMRENPRRLLDHSGPY